MPNIYGEIKWMTPSWARKVFGGIWHSKPYDVTYRITLQIDNDGEILGAVVNAVAPEMPIEKTWVLPNLSPRRATFSEMEGSPDLGIEYQIERMAEYLKRNKKELSK